ncbi:DUF2922 domain-containing protein [Fructilactobacillus lindneri]|uniref:DUF2922 domain-containing protein n=2 Tax=Fructilactobacillus lindneri TaxID=53444 RepID=A0A0R2JSE4_9LACO|nr:DUF2922 domain-containing protein [Fructilactobacillus lindneri]ANZ57422.1 hypothetical protein AYR60_00785 [Fructilactobacillus lindneri]ANZ58689.1 hypothetical protein AYR59_00785 [Fructilactobacillus lindneri]KRN80034.1 hypothetical protein IV52_GL000152 [Fructilactobacillus lindneri DSM 20690 = JCM 11027]POG97907.1 hypothetical protein BGL31_05225 [Fructilactobacillus lindneri]POG99239.1 hypothetical protein BGL32_05250 [Fructilactobacillus lindneri]
MKILELVFKSEQHKIRTMKLNYTNQNLQEAETKALMNRIVALEMFKKDGINLYATPVAARYAESKSYPIFDESKIPA